MAFILNMDDEKKWSRKGEEVHDDQDDILKAEAVTLHKAEAVTLHKAEAIIPPSSSKKSRKNPWKISVDESVNYGFNVIKDVLPHLLSSIMMYCGVIASLYISAGSDEALISTSFLIIAIILFVGGLLIQLALFIGLGYKFGGDILLRAVKTYSEVRKK